MSEQTFVQLDYAQPEGPGFGSRVSANGGLRSGDDLRSETIRFATDIAYKIDEVQRFVLSADLAQRDTDQTDLLNGDCADVVLGNAAM